MLPAFLIWSSWFSGLSFVFVLRGYFPVPFYCLPLCYLDFAYQRRSPFFPPSFTCLPVCFSCIWVHICINLTKPPILVYESAWKARISQQKLFAIANYTDVSLLWDTEIHQQPCRYPFVYILKENDIPVTLIPLTSGTYARPPAIMALTSVTSHQNVSNNWTIMALFQPTLC